MRQFAIRRLIFIPVTLFVVSVLIFSVVRLIPGDVTLIMVEQYAYAPTIEDLRERLGLNKPIYVQYMEWVGGMLRGDFGSSLWSGRSAAAELGRRLPVTLELAFLSI